MATIKEEFWVVAAGSATGPVFLDKAGELTLKVHLARHFASSDDASRALALAREIPGERDWRVFHAHSETMLHAF